MEVPWQKAYFAATCSALSRFGDDLSERGVEDIEGGLARHIFWVLYIFQTCLSILPSYGQPDGLNDAGQVFSNRCSLTSLQTIWKGLSSNCAAFHSWERNG